MNYYPIHIIVRVSQYQGKNPVKKQAESLLASQPGAKRPGTSCAPITGRLKACSRTIMKI